MTEIIGEDIYIQVDIDEPRLNLMTKIIFLDYNKFNYTIKEINIYKPDAESMDILSEILENICAELNDELLMN